MLRSTVDAGTILLTRAGSHAYGTSTPTSDLDVRGVFIPPVEYILGMSKIEQYQEAGTADRPDLVIYELRKYIALAADANPNILEIVFADDSDILSITDVGRILRSNRHLFLSKKARHTFSGYAMSQLKRIESHRRWLLNPPTAPPQRSDFGLPERHAIPGDQIKAAEAIIRKQVEAWENALPTFGVDVDDPAACIQMRDLLMQTLTEMRLSTDDERFQAAGRRVGFDANFLDMLDREHKYTQKRREWDSYQQWCSGRNEARSVLERKHGYDCYTSDTEFLTRRGWLRYEDIGDEDIGTVNQQSGQLEFQRPTERVQKAFAGEIADIDLQYTGCSVTLNHRMWVSPAHRSKANAFSTAYNVDQAAWTIAPLQSLLTSAKAWYHIRQACAGSTTEYDVSDDDLILIGAYVSEGCVGKRLKSGQPANLRFSQKEGNRLEPWLHKLTCPIHRYVYDRPPNKMRKNVCREAVWVLSDRKRSAWIASICGELSKDKHLPDWISQLSRRQARILLDVLIAGDGTSHKLASVYYTISRKLADDIQLLAVSAGYPAVIWGPYAHRAGQSRMYQISIRKEAGEFAAVHMPSSKTRTYNGDIVCFTVPNEILITRRNGKIAIQGNTKHGMHLVRLMRMCEEILCDGVVLVRRPDAEELLAIRNGAWSYEVLMQWARDMDARMASVAAASKLPNTPDRAAINALCVELMRAQEGIKRSLPF